MIEKVVQNKRSTTIRFEGDSGDGIITMGQICARTASRMGYHVYTYSTFLAVVRGGQVTFQLRIGTDPLLSQGDDPDILVALNRQTVEDHARSVHPDGIILHSLTLEETHTLIKNKVKAPRIGYQEIAVEETGISRAKNVVAAGVLSGLMSLDETIGEGVVTEKFIDKGAEVCDQNVRAYHAGYAKGQELRSEAENLYVALPVDAHPRMLMSGNEAIAYGALTAGVRFFAGYPITPASEIMEWLAKYLPLVGGKMIQAEDEIAALGMCIGAAYGGVKVMTATSGPGLSLQTELLGLAGMTEIPVVIVDVQRAGPSTGMPTKEAQGDLNMAVYGSHGEVPRVVLAPQSVADCFEKAVRAVNIACKFHVPVILLSSQSLSHRNQTIDAPDFENMYIYDEPFMTPEMFKGKTFKRYARMPDGLPSIRSIPGTPGGTYRATGLEHDETGNPDFEPDTRRMMVDRRRDRMLAVEREFQATMAHDTYFKGHCPIGVMSWGTTASTVREVLGEFTKEGKDFSYLCPRILWPLPDRSINMFLSSGIRLIFVFELNSTRQFAELIRARYTAELIKHGIEVISITKDEGLPFSPGEIRSAITSALAERRISEEIFA